jgi:hypothetical protein
MSDINTLNERTRLEAQHKETGDRLAALLIAIQRLPLEHRQTVMHQYEHNFMNIKEDRKEQKEVCDFCDGSGERSTDVDDGEGHVMQGVGDKEKCICQIKA